MDMRDYVFKNGVLVDVEEQRQKEVDEVLMRIELREKKEKEDRQKSIDEILRKLDFQEKQKSSGYYSKDIESQYCYCKSRSEDVMLLDISVKPIFISDDVLTSDCCWKEICRVRAKNRDKIDSNIWRVICSQRGRALKRKSYL